MDMKKEIKTIIKSQANINIVNIKLLGGGSFGKVYKCTDDKQNVYAFKIFLVESMAVNEANSLIFLNKNNVIKIPEVYFVKEKDDTTPFDCMLFEFIEGENALFNLKLLLASKKQKKVFADKVTDGLLAIHSIKSDKFGKIDGTSYNTWLEYYKPYAKNILEKAIEKNKQGNFDTYILKIMLHAWDKFDTIFDEDVTEACLIHGDINVMNIMVDKSLLPDAFIDPLNSMFADREYDLFQLQNLTGNCFNLYNTYKKKYNVSKNCDVKCAFYSLWNEAMVYENTGRYTGFIMKKAVNNMKKFLKIL